MNKIRAEMRDTEMAYAKINLALHVRERLPTGYHNIETIFAFLNCGDSLSVQECDGVKLTITGPFAKGLNTADNLVLQAANLLYNLSNFTAGAALNLEKNLPVASGIGGGSADAAATLRLLNRYWDMQYSLQELAELSAPLGADVPACVLSQTSLASGIGQDISLLDSAIWRGYSVLLVNPLEALSTEDVFNAWDGKDRGALSGKNVREIAANGRNDLQKPAQNCVPAIEEILTNLGKTAPIFTRMSGSGATCFGLYGNRQDADKARSVISAILPDVWTMIGEIL